MHRINVGQGNGRPWQQVTLAVTVSSALRRPSVWSVVGLLAAARCNTSRTRAIWLNIPTPCRTASRPRSSCCRTCPRPDLTQCTSLSILNTNCCWHRTAVRWTGTGPLWCWETHRPNCWTRKRRRNNPVKYFELFQDQHTAQFRCSWFIWSHITVSRTSESRTMGSTLNVERLYQLKISLYTYSKCVREVHWSVVKCSVVKCTEVYWSAVKCSEV